jgi:putative Mn2+ efflux pump MntP
MTNKTYFWLYFTAMIATSNLIGMNLKSNPINTWELSWNIIALLILAVGISYFINSFSKNKNDLTQEETTAIQTDVSHILNTIDLTEKQKNIRIELLRKLNEK